MTTVTNTQVRMMTIDGVPGLDPIRVVFQNIAPGKGRVIIACFADAWSAYWGAMGEKYSVERFFVGQGADYLKDSLIEGRSERLGYYQQKHLMKVITEVQRALHKELTA